MENRNIHRPRHIYLGEKIYFVTARTYKEKIYFDNIESKEIFKGIFVEAAGRFDIKIYAWVLISNHYHLLFKLGNKFRSAQFVNPKEKNKIFDENNITKIWNDEISETNFVKKKQLVEFIRKLHKDSSREINKLEKKKGRKIWYQYWDYCIRDEKDFYKHFNYIHNNPIKHKLVKNIEELSEYKYSSFNNWINKKDKEWIYSCFEQYPVLDFTVEGE